MSLLEVAGLHVAYGPVAALHGIDLAVEAAEVVVLIGANGAGKSTLLRAISGVQRCRGRIAFDGIDIAGRPPAEIVRRGVVHVPEGRQILQGMTVRENLEVGGYAVGRGARAVAADIGRILALFPALERLLPRMAWQLSGGEQQMLAIGRGLMAQPRLLLLDEPSLGLAPVIVQGLFAAIAQIARDGVTILLVEQNAHLALSIAQRAYVIEGGRIVRAGAAQALANDAALIDSYLGVVDAGAEPASA